VGSVIVADVEGHVSLHISFGAIVCQISLRRPVMRSGVVDVAAT
jgi:hypothetical protein